jgi:glycosyltransferase involved in cell wall biosynthesis
MSSPPAPEVSVVIPTRNRARSLERTLAALAVQSHPPDRFEVLVAANGCADDTAGLVRTWPAPFALRLVEQPASGMSRARNQGASAARGHVLVFLDDDVEPVPGFLAAHARAQRSGMDLVAVGPLLVPATPRPWSLLAERLHSLDGAFALLLASAPSLDWTCMTGGNVSMSWALFENTGGFDSGIGGYGSEDYEFALRAAKAGARFAFLPDAGGYHHRRDDDSLAVYLRRGRSMGRNDAALAPRHPEMVDRLKLGLIDRSHSLLGRLGRTLAFDRPRTGDAAARGLLLVAWMLAAMRRRRYWNRLVDGLHQYWYFRGVADQVGDGPAVVAFLDALRVRTRASG